jgi:S1-C subfamily serine protease
VRQATLHSRSRRPPPQAPAATPVAPAEPKKPSRLRAWIAAHRGTVYFAAGAVLAGLIFLMNGTGTPAHRQLTQDDIDAAVMRTLENNTLPSRLAKAFDIIRPAVVRVRGFGVDENGDEIERSVGTGVVIVDSGIILTNLHVVHGAKSIKVVFHDGLEADAAIIGVQPEHDLAVLQAKTIPDDLHAATLRSTAGLRPGEEVIAVGFPFGIGPSVSAGVISGLGREYQTADGKRVLTNLIQFDAAVNPGNSGGPLITPDGEVIGIVTGLLNPSEQRVFIGIGFAVPIENAAGAVGLSPF